MLNMIKESANRINMTTYRSQPTSKDYSRPIGHPMETKQPSIMQQAFLDAVLKA